MMINRRSFLRYSGALAASLLTGCLGVQQKESKASKRPNILFIMTDDHASHALSCYGSVTTRTPHLDRVANEGMRFKNCFCTNSICAPSRAVILTGKHSHINGQKTNSERFDGGQQTFPKLLQEVGYETAMIGKWHLQSDPTGFDHWEILPGQGAYYNPDFIQMDGSQKHYEGYSTDIITDLTIDWLDKQRDTNKPFMVKCHHKAPHRNWMPHPRHFGKHKHGTIPEPETLFADHSSRSKASPESAMSIRDHFFWGWDMKFHGPNLFPDHFMSGLENLEYQRMTAEQKAEWDAHYEPENQAFIQQMQQGTLSEEDIVRWKYQRYMHDYLGTISAVDEGVGRILDYLDEQGLSDNTVVVYTSDQGFFLGEHGWYDKRFMYEESLRMPLLVRRPGQIKAASVADQIVLNLDFAPTFVDMADRVIPSDIQGESMLSILKGQRPPDWRTAMYYHYYEYPGPHQVKRHYGIRTHRYKLIHFYDINAWELYDLAEDPHELKNLYGDRRYSELVKQLTEHLQALQKQYDDSEGLALSKAIE